MAIFNGENVFFFFKTIKMRGTVLPYLQTRPSLVSCTISLGMKRIEEQNFVRHQLREKCDTNGEDRKLDMDEVAEKINFQPMQQTTKPTACFCHGVSPVSVCGLYAIHGSIWQVLSE